MRSTAACLFVARLFIFVIGAAAVQTLSLAFKAIIGVNSSNLGFLLFDKALPQVRRATLPGFACGIVL